MHLLSPWGSSCHKWRKRYELQPDGARKTYDCCTMLNKQDLLLTATFCFSCFYLYNPLLSPKSRNLREKQHSLCDGKQGVRRKVRVRKSRWARKGVCLRGGKGGVLVFSLTAVWMKCWRKSSTLCPPCAPIQPLTTPLQHPSPCLVQRRSPGASGLCQKHWLDVFYVQHCWLSWGPLWLFIYLFHSSRVIVPICYTKVLGLPWDSCRFYCRAPVCLWNSLSLSFKVKLDFFFFLKSALLSCASFNNSVCTFLLLPQHPTMFSPPSTRRSRLTCATMRGGTTMNRTRCTPCTGKSPAFLFSENNKNKI